MENRFQFNKHSRQLQMKLTIYSLNIQGLKNPNRKINLIKLINKFQPTILCLQETNINIITDPKILIPNYTVIYNSATTKSSGTAILISNTVSVESHNILLDSKCQRVVVNFDSQQLIIINIHMPHKNIESYNLINIIENDLANSCPSNIILCGDWNYVDNPSMDYKNHNSDRIRIRRKMETIINRYNLIDTFRFLYPRKIAMTHTGVQSHQPQGRLDRIYISSRLSSSLHSAEILPSFSDHAIVNSTLSLGTQGNKSYWKLNNTVLSNDDCIKDIKELLVQFSQSTSKSYSCYETLKFNIKKNCP